MEPIEDPAGVVAEILVNDFAEIKKHVGSQWAPGHFEIGIKINPETGRPKFTVYGFTYDMLEGAAIRSKREGARRIISAFRNVYVTSPAAYC